MSGVARFVAVANDFLAIEAESRGRGIDWPEADEARSLLVHALMLLAGRPLADDEIDELEVVGLRLRASARDAIARVEEMQP